MMPRALLDSCKAVVDATGIEPVTPAGGKLLVGLKSQ